FLEDLKRIKCPTLVLGGEDDPIAPIADSEDIAAGLPHELVRFERFVGCGHGGMFGAPEQFLQVIRDFLKEQPTKGRPLVVWEARLRVEGPDQGLESTRTRWWNALPTKCERPPAFKARDQTTAGRAGCLIDDS